jgi:hypothetical protein
MELSSGFSTVALSRGGGLLLVRKASFSAVARQQGAACSAEVANSPNRREHRGEFENHWEHHNYQNHRKNEKTKRKDHFPVHSSIPIATAV